MFDTLARPTRFTLVGVANTLVDVGVFATVIACTAMSPVVANIAGYSADRQQLRFEPQLDVRGPARLRVIARIRTFLERQHSDDEFKHFHSLGDGACSWLAAGQDRLGHGRFRLQLRAQPRICFPTSMNAVKRADVTNAVPAPIAIQCAAQR